MSATSAVEDPRAAVSYALRELLVMKEELSFSRTQTHRFKIADRKMLRIHRALVKQTLDLASELHRLGATRSEISSIISEAKSIARVRRVASS